MSICILQGICPFPQNLVRDPQLYNTGLEERKVNGFVSLVICSFEEMGDDNLSDLRVNGVGKDALRTLC